MIDLRNLFKITIIRFIPSLGALLLSFIAARFLSVEEVSEYYFWLVVIYTSSYITGLGLDTYLLREISREKVNETSSLKRSAFLFSLLAAISSMLLLNFSEAWILISLPMFVVVGINSKILRAEGMYEMSSLLEISCISALSFLLLLLVPMRALNLDFFKAIFVFSSFIIMIFGEYSISNCYRITHVNSANLFSFKVNAMNYSVYPFIIFITQWFPLFLLKGISSHDVAVYSLAIRSAAVFTFLSMSFDSYLSVKISQMHHDSEHTKLSHLLTNSSKIAFLLSIFLLIGFIFIGERAIVLLTSIDYQGVYIVALPVVSMYMMAFIFGQYQGYLLMTNSEGYVNSSNFISMIIVVLLCVLLDKLDLLSSLTGSCALFIGRSVGILRMRYVGIKILHIRMRHVRYS